MSTRIPPVISLRHATPPPAAWTRTVHRVLIPSRQIARRVRQLALQIEQDDAGRELLLIPLLSGTVLFVADLVRHLHLPVRLDFLGLSSYRASTRPGPLRLTKSLASNPRGQHVLLVDDILDTGRTLDFARRHIAALRPRSLRTCVLLEKRTRRSIPHRPDYVGFSIPNSFVVGYGLDHAERFRHLPFIALLKRHPS